MYHITVECQHCGAQGALPAPSAYQLPNGALVEAADAPAQLRAMEASIATWPCPACGQYRLKTRRPSDEEQRELVLYDIRAETFTHAVRQGQWPPRLCYDLLQALITGWSQEEMYLLN